MIFASFKNCLLEFLGTFTMVFFSSFGYSVFKSDQISVLGMGLLNGFNLMIFTWICKDVTLAQFNPLITLLLLILKKIKVRALLSLHLH